MRVIVLVAVAFIAILAMVVLANQMSACICSFTGPCIKAEDGTWVRYYQCQGSCFAYSDYEQYPKCANPRYKPRELLETRPTG